jgi:hypothetical protein
MEGYEVTFYEDGHTQHDGYGVHAVEDPEGEWVEVEAARAEAKSARAAGCDYAYEECAEAVELYFGEAGKWLADHIRTRKSKK